MPTDWERKPEILAVDDDHGILAVLTALLTELGGTMRTATCVAEAEAAMATLMPDVLLLDAMMPGEDGFAFCQRLKATPAYRFLPVLMITALDGAEFIARGLGAGADDFISKPIDAVVLRARVRSLLRIKRLYDERTRLLQFNEDWTHMLAHDMRQPLTAIQGYSELLATGNTLGGDDQELLQRIQVGAQGLQRQLDDILAVGRFEANRVVLNPRPLEVTQLIAEALDTVRFEAEKREVRLRADTAALGGAARVSHLDPELLLRVLINLLANAIRHSPRQGVVTVTAEGIDSSPPTAAAAHALRLRFRVSDEGPGVPVPLRERIFDKYEMVAMHRRGERQAGIGLYFCQLAVAAHGGSIRVGDHSPTGAEFRVDV